MNIGIQCSEYPPCKHGGIGSFTKDLAEGLVRQGHDVTVFGYYYSNVLDLDDKVDEIINGVRVLRYPPYNRFSNKRLNLIFSRFDMQKNIRQLHRQKAFDVIESPENEGWLALGTPDRIPLITRFHGGVAYFGAELGRKVSRLIKSLEKMQLRRSTHLVSVSKYTAQRTMDLFHLNRDYSVIYNAVQLPRDLECSEEFESHLIVFAGSVIPKKGVEGLVRAMNVIGSVYPDAKIVLAGKNTHRVNGEAYESYLLSLVEEPYRDRVVFAGPLDREKELFPLLCQAHVCCYPSFSEAFALAPLEAMGLGKAVVYSKLSSGPEAIEDGVTGLLCDPAEPEDIAEKILYYFREPEQMEKIRGNGRRAIQEKFSYTEWIHRNVEMFEAYRKKM